MINCVKCPKCNFPKETKVGNTRISLVVSSSPLGPSPTVENNQLEIHTHQPHTQNNAERAGRTATASDSHGPSPDALGHSHLLTLDKPNHVFYRAGRHAGRHAAPNLHVGVYLSIRTWGVVEAAEAFFFLILSRMRNVLTLTPGS